MKKTIFKGIATALITPTTATGVDYDKLARLIDWQIDEGIDALVICGTTGESSTLTDKEHKEVIEFSVRQADGRVPIIAGTGSNETAYAIELTKSACEAGADAALVVTPYYNKATQNGLVKTFSTIADCSDLPIILYNVPSRTGSNILPDTAAYLGKNVENIVAIKEASGNISQIAKLAQLADGCLDIYSGNDDQVVPILALGGIGVISVLSNVAPRQTHDMVMTYLEGNVKESLRLQLEAIPLIDALFCEVNPIPVKTAMNLLGKECGPLRGPLSPMEPQNEEKLRKAMIGYGLTLA